MNYKKIFNVVGVVAVAVVFCVGCNQNDKLGESPNDGKGDDSYRYNGGVKIGNQTWMAENLNRATINSKCYGNSADSCAKYGRLYTWTDAKKSCPTGWHLPSDAEWNTLITAAGGASTAGKKLKATSGWGDDDNNYPKGTDEYGFSALPGGTFNTSDGFHSAGYIGFWWSGTKAQSVTAWFLDMSSYSDNVNRSDGNDMLLSVRCVQN